MWAQQGSNLRPPDYESGAANQLSYGPLLEVQIYSFIATLSPIVEIFLILTDTKVGPNL